MATSEESTPDPPVQSFSETGQGWWGEGIAPLRASGERTEYPTRVLAVAQNQRGEVVTSPVAHQLTAGGGKPGEGYAAVISSSDEPTTSAGSSSSGVGPGPAAPDASQMSMFSAADHPVRTGRSLDAVRAWLDSAPGSSSSSPASLVSSLPAGFSLRTSLAYCPPARAGSADPLTGRTRKTREPSQVTLDEIIAAPISPPSSRNSAVSGRPSPPMAGGTPELAADPREPWPGGFWTLNGSESPRGAAVCSLSSIVEAPHPGLRRYFLTARACQGILRRAARRGRDLPAPLQAALTAAAQAAPTRIEPKPGL